MLLSRPKLSNERGAAAVEFALLSTVLFLIVFGIIAFGQFYSRYNVFVGAAREGARYAAIRDLTTHQGPDVGAVTAKIDQAASPYTRTGAVSISPACNDSTAGSAITVSWTQPFDIEIVMLPTIHKDVQIKGVFRCE